VDVFRARVAVLWVAVAVAASSSFLLYLFVPGVTEQMLAGEMEGEPLTDAVGFMLAMFVIVPLVMTAVTLLASGRVSRYASSIAALVLGLAGSFGVVSHLLAGEFNGHVLMAMLACFLAFLIAGLGLVALRQPTAPAAPPTSELDRPAASTPV
jgi:hypothetical protein